MRQQAEAQGQAFMFFGELARHLRSPALSTADKQVRDHIEAADRCSVAHAKAPGLHIGFNADVVACAVQQEHHASQPALLRATCQ